MLRAQLIALLAISDAASASEACATGTFTCADEWAGGYCAEPSVGTPATNALGDPLVASVIGVGERVSAIASWSDPIFRGAGCAAPFSGNTPAYTSVQAKTSRGPRPMAPTSSGP